MIIGMVLKILITIPYLDLRNPGRPFEDGDAAAVAEDTVAGGVD